MDANVLYREREGGGKERRGRKGKLLLFIKADSFASSGLQGMIDLYTLTWTSRIREHQSCDRVD